MEVEGGGGREVIGGLVLAMCVCVGWEVCDGVFECVY